ncbi:hypothetical protein [Demequina aurantiaca]|uniref:hypothetical protein n=1 Tax=Demequina aurantiaca TaxID=676200 RepID=UPI000A54B5C9|nr:hypothetical protein [Demequina aurantiaca]
MLQPATLSSSERGHAQRDGRGLDLAHLVRHDGNHQLKWFILVEIRSVTIDAQLGAL